MALAALTRILPPRPAVWLPLAEPDARMLDALIGLHIRDICPLGVHGNERNHCAHFVGHVLGLKGGTTCRQLRRPDITDPQAMQRAAAIRVNEVFALCKDPGEWQRKPATLSRGLAFATGGTHYVKLQPQAWMGDGPQKHVGIFLDDRIWHYSNTRRQVVCVSPQGFARHYGINTFMYFGVLPA